MNRSVVTIACLSTLTAVLGCVSAPFNPEPSAALPSPAASAIATNVAASAGPAPAGSVPPAPAASVAPSPAGSAAPKPPAASAPAAAASPKPAAAPAASTAPKPAATPIPYPYKSFYFAYPATWSIVNEVRNPLKLTLKPSKGDAVLSIRELTKTTDLAAQRTRVVAEVGLGLISNTAATLDSSAGFSIIWNRTEDGQSRYHVTRGFIYKETYFEIEANWYRPSPEMAAIDADVTALLKTWLWQ